MRILALDAALARCAAALVEDGVVRAVRQCTAQRGHAGLLPPMAEAVLQDAAPPDIIAVTLGPGSFTGLRAALSLAHGLALGYAVPVVGVSVGEAMAQALPLLGTRVLWTAIDTSRDRVFLEAGGEISACALDALPAPTVRVALAGDAAVAVAARLAARGADVMLTDVRLPDVLHVAAAARRRLEGTIPPRPVLPLYVDAPQAVLPARGLRPPPA